VQRTLSFQQQGYPAARITTRENFNHEHQDVRSRTASVATAAVRGLTYTARVARVNAALLGLRPTRPTPKNLQIHTTRRPASRHHLTALSWDANPEPRPAGYEVVMRETTAANWTSAIWCRQRHLGHR